MGVKIDQFDGPVCNAFRTKIINDQLCYEVDLNTFANKNNIKRELKLGFNFLLDYNEDRQVKKDQNFGRIKKDNNLASVVESDQDDQAFIYLNTVGKQNYVIQYLCLLDLTKLLNF